MDKNVPSWDNYFMDIAYVVSKRSKDPNTKVGCVLVDSDNHIIATGYNGFVAGIEETPSMWERPYKYDYVIHAENNAISYAAKKGVATKGATAYVTAFPCLECMKKLLPAGISRVVADYLINGWDESHGKAKQIAEGVGVKVEVRNNPIRAVDEQMRLV